MKLSAVTTAACLATGAWSRALVERDIGTITGAIDQVGKGLEALDSAVKGFSGDIGPIQDAADKLISTLKDGEAKVSGSDKLTLTDALGLQQPVKDLQSKGEALEASFKAYRPGVEQLGKCGLVREKLGGINSGSLSLIKAVVGKVPTEAQPIAENLASGLKKVLQQATDDFSESNCKDKACAKPSSSAKSSESAPPSSPSPSSAPAEPSAPATSTGATYPIPGVPSKPAVHPTGTGAPVPSTTGQPPVTAGAGAIVVPAGAMVAAFAALLI